MNNAMLDLETMGSGPNAAIVAIGAVMFDIDTRQIGDTFYEVIDLESSVSTGGVIDASTVQWWLQQSDDARKAIDGTRPSIPMDRALIRFKKWLTVWPTYDVYKNGYTGCIWGNGAAFDNVILASAYRRRGMPIPWSHWNDRCYRTVKALHRHVKLERVGTHHNALDDAISQANHLIAMLNPTPSEPAA